jgi:hypothetical protein
MTLEDLKKEFKTSYEFNKRTGMAHTNWINWFGRFGYVPIESQMKIEQRTKGLLKANLDHIPKKGE